MGDLACDMAMPRPEQLNFFHAFPVLRCAYSFCKRADGVELGEIAFLSSNSTNMSMKMMRTEAIRRSMVNAQVLSTGCQRLWPAGWDPVDGMPSGSG